MVDALTKTALIGTSRQTTGADETGTAIDEFLAGAREIDRELRLLLAAGALDVYRRAGYIAPPAPEPHAPALPDPAQVVSSRAAALIAAMLRGRHAELLPEALGRTRQAGLRLPPSLLPLALAARTEGERTLLRPVLGERGRWLAQFNPDWRWAIDEVAGEGIPARAEAIWEEGTPGQRLDVLRRVRRADPARARAWVEAAWKGEKADYRKEILEALAEGLSPDDESLLETAIDDRAASVRKAAASLLARLPDSALAARMHQRADALLAYAPTPTGLRGRITSIAGKRTRTSLLRVDVDALPEAGALDAAWQCDGIELKPPRGTGERAWWLVQALALIPPAHWEQRFAAAPGDLLQALRHDEWEQNVAQGWTRAALLHEDARWAAALWQWWYGRKADLSTLPEVKEALRSLTTGMDRVEAEYLLTSAISAPDAREDRWLEALGALPTPWGVDLGAAFLHALERYAAESGKQQRNATAWWQVTAAAWHALSPALFPRALWVAAQAQPGDPYSIQQQLKTMAAIIEIRQQIVKEIPL